MTAASIYIKSQKRQQYKSSKNKLIKPLFLGARCNPPPEVPNAKYTPLETYPARSEVKYECINSRYINKGTNNTKLICAELVSGETIWIGDKIDCQLSPEIGMFSFSVYTFFFGQVHNLQFLKWFAYASALGQNLYHHQQVLPKTVLA